jgi:hypothetical protein
MRSEERMIYRIPFLFSQGLRVVITQWFMGIERTKEQTAPIQKSLDIM